MKKLVTDVQDRHYEVYENGDIYAYHSKIPISDMLWIIQEYQRVFGPIKYEVNIVGWRGLIGTAE